MFPCFHLQKRTESRANMNSQTNRCCSSVLLLLLCMSPVLCTSRQCSTEKIQGFTINIQPALSNRVKSYEPFHTSTEEACLNLCCSPANISGNMNCTFMTFDSQKGRNLPNCYLLYCPTKEACPLKPYTGLVSYRILQDEKHLEADGFTNQSLDIRQLGLHKNLSSPQANSSASEHPAAKHNSSNNLQKSIAAHILDLAKNVDKQLEKMDRSDKHRIYLNEDEEHDGNQNISNKAESFQIKKVSVFPTKASVTIRPTTSTVLTTTVITTRTLNATTTTPTPQATTTFATASTTTSQATTTSTTTSTTTIQATTTSTTTTTPAARTTSSTTTTIQPTTTPTIRKATTILTTTSITTQQPMLTSSSTIRPTTHITTRTTASNYSVPKNFNINSPSSGSQPPPTGTKSGTASIRATGAVSSSYTPPANINSSGLGKSITQHEWINSKENQIVDNKGGRNSASSQSSDRSGLVAALCFGVAFLILIMVLVGRAAIESFQQRHYSRLDYLINGMYVDT